MTLQWGHTSIWTSVGCLFVSLSAGTVSVIRRHPVTRRVHQLRGEGSSGPSLRFSNPRSLEDTAGLRETAERGAVLLQLRASFSRVQLRGKGIQHGPTPPQRSGKPRSADGILQADVGARAFLGANDSPPHPPPKGIVGAPTPLILPSQAPSTSGRIRLRVGM